MPETTPEKSPADAWSGAYQAATEQLRGLGPNEPPKTRGAVRALVAKAAADHFTEAGVKFARVSATITWGKDKPAVMLELITMDGQRHEGREAIDPRMSLGVNAADPSIAAVGFRPGAAEPEPMPNEAQFFADVLAEDEARIARSEPA